MTYDQYRLMPEDGKRYELVNGELLMTPSPTTRHQRIVRDLSFALSAHVKQKGLGEIFIAPLDVVFEDHTVLEPDILFVRRDRASIVGEEAIHGAPDLVVEILSPSSFYHDLRVKMLLYGKFGVEEYWVVDPDKEIIEQFRLAGTGLELARQFASDAALESAIFPGFRLPVKSIFE